MNHSGASTLPLLAGRKGLVIGISGPNSVGFACARTMQAMGADVAVTYRPARQSQCAPLCEEAGFALHQGVDVDDEGSLARAMEACARCFGRLDFLLHTIVHVPRGVLEQPLLALSRADFNRVMEVSAHSLVVVCRNALPLLEVSSSPRVVTLTSASERLMTPRYHVAGIAKAALRATLSYLAYELGPRGVLCNAVSFSLVTTDGALAAVGEDPARATRAVLAKKAPTRKTVELDDVARATAWLCSSHCTQMTAEVVTVDGGFSQTYF